MNCSVYLLSQQLVRSLTEPYLFSQVKNGIIQSKIQTCMQYSCLTNAATIAGGSEAEYEADQTFKCSFPEL